VIQVEFTNQILSTFNHTLASNILEAKLQEYDLPGFQTKEAREQAQALTAGAVTALFSLVNPNPSTLWNLMNTLEVISYITLSKNPLTPRTKGLLRLLWLGRLRIA